MFAIDSLASSKMYPSLSQSSSESHIFLIGISKAYLWAVDESPNLVHYFAGLMSHDSIIEFYGDDETSFQQLQL
jgi:hypothetical protein